MDALRTRLATAMTRVTSRLQSLGITPVSTPDAGIFLWCKLPDGMNAATVARNALADGVVLAPGNVFSISQTADDLMRFNVAQCDDPKLFEILIRAMG